VQALYFISKYDLDTKISRERKRALKRLIFKRDKKKM